MRVELNFQHKYQVEVGAELPGSPGLTEQVYFPAATGGTCGAIVRVTPSDRPPWIGIFQRGDLYSDRADGVYGCPDGESFLVVTGGAGYIVSANDPASWQRASVLPVTDVRLFKEKAILVLTGFSDLAAYGTSGLRWELRRVVDDELSVTGVTGQYLSCRGWSAPKSDYTDLWVDIQSGGIIDSGRLPRVG